MVLATELAPGGEADADAVHATVPAEVSEEAREMKKPLRCAPFATSWVGTAGKNPKPRAKSSAGAPQTRRQFALGGTNGWSCSY